MVGNGQGMSFWEDKWCGEVSLRVAFPSVFSLPADPRARVADYLEERNGSPVWHAILRRPAFDWELRDIEAFLGRLALVEVDPSQLDRRVWQGNTRGMFCVRSCVEFLDRSEAIELPWRGIWYTHIPPPKVQFMWMSYLGRVSTIDVLQKK